MEITDRRCRTAFDKAALLPPVFAGRRAARPMPYDQLSARSELCYGISGRGGEPSGQRSQDGDGRSGNLAAALVCQIRCAFRNSCAKPHIRQAMKPLSFQPFPLTFEARLIASLSVGLLFVQPGLRPPSEQLELLQRSWLARRNCARVASAQNLGDCHHESAPIAGASF